LCEGFIATVRRKNDFAENLKISLELKIILWDHQNKLRRNLKYDANDIAKNLLILAINLSILHNYFDRSTKFSDLSS